MSEDQEKKTLEKIIGAILGLSSVLMMLKSIHRKTYAEIKPEHKEIHASSYIMLFDTADISDQPTLLVEDNIQINSSVIIYLMGV
ncbi:MAG: hypothetical protein QXR31_01455 [Zestosphaera sp.]